MQESPIALIVFELFTLSISLLFVVPIVISTKKTQSHQVQTYITIDNTSKAIEKHIHSTFILL